MIGNQAISTMFDDIIFFHMVRIVQNGIKTKTLGDSITFPGCDGD